MTLFTALIDPKVVAIHISLKSRRYTHAELRVLSGRLIKTALFGRLIATSRRRRMSVVSGVGVGVLKQAALEPAPPTIQRRKTGVFQRRLNLLVSDLLES